MSNTNKLYNLALFIFRRDLRLEDNKGLLHCLRLSKTVLPCFIFDKIQIDSSKNEYFSHNCVQFMMESLKDLNDSLSHHGSRLFFFHDDMDNIINKICKEIKPEAIFFNEDVTPYALKRDKLIQDICKQQNIKHYSFEDIMLLPKDRVLLSTGKFYQKFTPYYNNASVFEIDKPIKNTYDNYLSAKTTYSFEYPYQDIDQFYDCNPHLEVHGGRKNGLKIIQNIKQFKNYTETRNFPRLASTKLSAYNKFGVVSIREIYHSVKDEIGKSCDLIKQLYWRDFYYNIVYYYPHVIGDAMRQKYSALEWGNDNEYFEKWKDGKTGCPIVDAAMRHLNKTGYMPNRLRMIVANYLIKDLLIDWRWGEKYFATKLVDYDPSQNNGGWQWASGTGTDSQPYFRIFNPKLQSEKFDNECEYIFKWIPELKSVPKKSVHNWGVDYINFKKLKIDYSDPLVKHDVQKKKCLDMYIKVAGNEQKSSTIKDEDEDEDKDKDKDNGEETKKDKKASDVKKKSKSSNSKSENTRNAPKKRKAEDDGKTQTITSMLSKKIKKNI